jgi:benzodiazapine receptor
MSDKKRDVLGLVVSVAVPLAAGGLGSISTISAIPTWYRGLRKPPWTPPNWIFGPAWTLLYTLMGISVWLVARSGWERRDVRMSTGLFGVQLLLNALWTPIFFGLKKPSLALAEIVPLWGLIAATAVQFFKIRPVAGLLLVPYLLWTTYATSLNAGIWWLNREK